MPTPGCGPRLRATAAAAVVVRRGARSGPPARSDWPHGPTVASDPGIRAARTRPFVQLSAPAFSARRAASDRGVHVPLPRSPPARADPRHPDPLPPVCAAAIRLVPATSSARAARSPTPPVRQQCSMPYPGRRDPSNPLDLPVAPGSNPLNGARFFVPGPAKGAAASAIAQLVGLNPLTLPVDESWATLQPGSDQRPAGAQAGHQPDPRARGGRAVQDRLSARGSAPEQLLLGRQSRRASSSRPRRSSART